MMRAIRLAFVIILLALLLATPREAAFAQPSVPAFVIVVNPSNATTTLERKFLEDAFLKKTTRWPNGEVIRPVDLAPESSVRRKFSEDVIRRSVASVRSYWQQIIFAGRDVPPPEFDTEDDVVKYVLKHAGGVGYVSGGASIGNLRVVGVR